jgi:hypothetical protein
MNFILDSGIKDPIITELTLVEELNLNYMKAIELKGLGTDLTTQAYQWATILLPSGYAGAASENQRDHRRELSNFANMGMPVHGLIGFNNVQQLCNQGRLYLRSTYLLPSRCF